jgi:hypothetical protein
MSRPSHPPLHDMLDSIGPRFEIHPAPGVPPTPLLIDTDGLAALLGRSVASLHRDDAAGRLPAALRIGGSKKWRYSYIVAWVELGCPSRADFEARRRNHR